MTALTRVDPLTKNNQIWNLELNIRNFKQDYLSKIGYSTDIFSNKNLFRKYHFRHLNYSRSRIYAPEIGVILSI